MSECKIVEASVEDYEYLCEAGGGSPEDGLAMLIKERRKISAIVEKFGLAKYINMANVAAKIRSRL